MEQDQLPSAQMPKPEKPQLTNSWGFLWFNTCPQLSYAKACLSSLGAGR
jgi:hypothetical protein